VEREPLRDPEFDAALDAAEATLDVAVRKPSSRRPRRSCRTTR